MESGRAQLSARRYDQAVFSFRGALTACPETQRRMLLLDLARAEMVSQQVASCLRTIDELLHENPRDAVALKLQSDAYFLTGREVEAERSLEAAEKAAPKDPDVPYALGRIYYQQHRYREAMGQFQKTIRLDAKAYKAYDNLGLCLEALNDTQGATYAFKKSLELVYKDHTDYDWPYGNLAELMMKLEDYQQAFELAAEAASRNPHSARNFFLTGKALSKLEKWELSERWLKRATELDGDYAEAHYLLARVYRMLRRDREASAELDTFRKIAATQPRERR